MKITDIMPLCSALVYVPEVVAALSESNEMRDIAQIIVDENGNCINDDFDCDECPLNRYYGCVPGHYNKNIKLRVAYTAMFLKYALEIYHARYGESTT